MEIREGMAEATIRPVTDEPVEPAIVVGAGVAGLRRAHALDERRRADGDPGKRKAGWPSPGTAGQQLHLNTHRDLSALPGLAYPGGTPAFPHRNIVIRHMNDFKEANRLPVEFGVAVETIVFRGDHWAVRTSAGSRLARHVVVATGRDKEPFTPLWKGTQAFAGQIIHSADFGDAKAYAGKKVLVVGAGNSGFDALNHLAGISTAAIWLSARNGPALLPKRIGKIAVHRLSPCSWRACPAGRRCGDGATQRLVFGRPDQIPACRPRLQAAPAA